MRPRAIALLVAAVLLLPLVLAAGWVATFEVRLPGSTGPYAVGRAFGSFGEERRVAYTLYHPARAGTGEPGPYVRESIADALAERDMGAFQHLPGAWSRVRHGAVDGAEWAEGEFPLVVFSPGAGTQVEYYSSLLVELASHGYVVAALAHPGVTPIVAYEDGTFTQSAEDPLPRGEAEAMRAFEGRVDLVASDVLGALAHLHAAERTGEHLDGRAAAIGHSLGGAGAAEAAARDLRIHAVADLDGSLGDEARATPLARPTLFVQDEGFVAARDAAARQAFVDGGAPGRMETIPAVSHSLFVSDAGHFEELRPFARREGPGADEAWRLVSSILVEFLGEAFA